MDRFEVSKFQWVEGERRLAAAETDRMALELVVDRIVEELRRRLGGPFNAAELVDLYELGTDWCFELALSVAPGSPAAWDGAVVADAAFGRYLREASDYAGGRIIDPSEESQR